MDRFSKIILTTVTILMIVFVALLFDYLNEDERENINLEERIRVIEPEQNSNIEENETEEKPPVIIEDIETLEDLKSDNLDSALSDIEFIEIPN